MKTNINLGLAFRDTYGTLIVNLQLVPVGGRKAIGIADFKDGHCTRFLISSKAKQNTASFRPSEFRRTADECAQVDSVKSLEWAYPTSESAVNHEHGKTGCWIIQLGKLGSPYHAVRAFPADQFNYALSVCRDLPFNWCPITVRCHPEYDAAGVSST